jgi:SAM-dependent methyltransferase
VRKRAGWPYTRAFFERIADGSRASAEAIVPLLVDLVRPLSVVDVGCGVGTWLAVFQGHGARDVLGLDGDYVPRDRLEIPADRFVPVDLRNPLPVDGSFDLAICLEVAEHLPPAAADRIVASLVRLSDVVLFSAAIPRQPGRGHVNPRWQSWWAERFAAHGYVPVDAIRRRVWSDPDVDWWYAQNALLYTREIALDEHPPLRREYDLMGDAQLSIVHPGRYLQSRTRVRRLLARLARRVKPGRRRRSGRRPRAARPPCRSSPR